MPTGLSMALMLCHVEPTRIHVKAKLWLEPLLKGRLYYLTIASVTTDLIQDP